jgi:alpha-glucoside transport system permease protein
MDPRLFTALVVVVGVPAVLVGYIWGTEQVLKLLPERAKPRIRPWLWLLPALAFLFIFLVYPTIGTVVRSFQSKGNILGAGTQFIGLDNYIWFFSDSRSLNALKNNVLWLVFLTLFTVGLGLLIAILVDRVRYESFAKSVIFLPLAISMVAASVIWKFMYDYDRDVGTLNAIAGVFGAGPVNWLQTGNFSLTTFMLIIIMTWMWTGFAMVIISAGLKGINTELLEAARVDGANEWQVFRGIIFPLLLPTIAVVATTIIITALKAFDIVYTTTNGNYDTEVIANLMYKEMFTNVNFGRAGALAVVLLLAIIPIMAFNVRRFQAQEAVR